MRHDYLKLICIGTYAYCPTERFAAIIKYFSKIVTLVAYPVPLSFKISVLLQYEECDYRGRKMGSAEE